MKTSIRVCLLVLTIFGGTPAQQSASPCEQKDQKIAAVVMAPVVGTCQVRDHENAQPEPIKAGQAVRAYQQLQCKSGGRLKIQFCKTRKEREIAHKANWYVVPNVASLSQPSGLAAAIRISPMNWQCPAEALSQRPCTILFYYPDAVVKKEVELWSLYQRKEAKGLGEAMSDDFYATYSDGQKVSKQLFLQDMLKINLKDYLWSDVTANPSPQNDSKKLSYVVFAHLLKDGQESSILIEVTSNWILRDGRWYIQSHQQKNVLDSDG